MPTHVTGPPELEMAAEPSGPQGIPIAGRVSRPVGRVVVAGFGFATVVWGAVVSALAVVVGAALVVGVTVVFGAAVVVATRGGGATGGAAGGGGGAMTAGGAMNAGAVV
ncbi:MAG TPA: hypothetical protein VN741_07990, partial [Mycobacterium sp.]|nr:hypothetical protein [Mycobacterium sp.]